MSLETVTGSLTGLAKRPGIAGPFRGFVSRRSSSAESADVTTLQRAALDRCICYLVISADLEFLDKLDLVAIQQSWTVAKLPLLADALNATGIEDYPVVVLDQAACEGTWENSLAVLASSAQAPCVLLRSPYGDEYLLREVVHLGGYDVLIKSAPPGVIARAVEFAWFWSQHSVTNFQPGPSAFAALPTSIRGPRT